MSTAEDLEEIRVTLQAIAAKHPNVITFAMIDQLIDDSCGGSPALRDVVRLQFYRRVYERAAALLPKTATTEVDHVED